MKKIILNIIAAFILISSNNLVTAKELKMCIYASSNISIKIKNDTGDEVSVINAGSGGTYRLQKNIVTTIKMDEGDKLYIYEKGKKGALLLEASSDMDGKVQLLSKL